MILRHVQYLSHKNKAPHPSKASVGTWQHYTSVFYSPHFFFRDSSLNCEKCLLASSCLSVCPSARNNSVPTGRIFIKFGIWIFFRNLSRKSDRNNGFLREDLRKFVMLHRWIPLTMRDISDKSGENQNTHFVDLFQATNLMHNSSIL